MVQILKKIYAIGNFPQEYHNSRKTRKKIIIFYNTQNYYNYTILQYENITIIQIQQTGNVLKST